MNYYQVHLNKSPKRIPKRRINPKRAHTVIIGAMGAIQIRTIQSNVFLDISDKRQRIASCVLDTAKSIQRLWSPKQKYLDRIKKLNHE